MKQLITRLRYPSLLTFFTMLFLQVTSWAQDSTGSSSSSSSTRIRTESTTTTTWYTQPWVWVVGGAVLILIIVALLRGNSSTDRTATHTSRTTVIKDRE